MRTHCSFFIGTDKSPLRGAEQFWFFFGLLQEAGLFIKKYIFWTQICLVNSVKTNLRTKLVLCWGDLFLEFTISKLNVLFIQIIIGNQRLKPGFRLKQPFKIVCARCGFLKGNN